MSATKGKVVAITGASSGIGEATALLLAERGAKVVLGARGSEKLAALVDRIVGSGGDAAHAPTDVRSREDLSALVALAREQYGKLDVLINNAGVMPISPLDELRVDDWDEMIEPPQVRAVAHVLARPQALPARGADHVAGDLLQDRLEDETDRTLEDRAQVVLEVLLRRQLKLGNLVHREVSSTSPASEASSLVVRGTSLLFSASASFRTTQA
jgi:hypothetical protein